MYSSDLYYKLSVAEPNSINLLEIEKLLRWQNDYIIELDNFLVLIHNRGSFGHYKSLFLEDNLIFDRTFIGETIIKLNYFRNTIGKSIEIINQPITYFLQSKPDDEQILKSFKEDFEKLDNNVIFGMRTYFIGAFKAKIHHVLTSIWGLFLEAEPKYIKGLEHLKAKKIIREKLLEIKESKIKSPKGSFLRDNYREKEQKIYELLKDHFENLEDNSEEKNLLRVILNSLKKVQGLSAIMPSNEKARTRFTAEFIRDFIAKDESGYGMSESLKTIGEIDILIERKDSSALAICEGFNLKNSLAKGIINTHINKLFNYDANGLKANFVLIYATTDNLPVFWGKYYKYIQTIATPFILIEAMDLSTTYSDLPSDIKLCKLSYLRNGILVTVYHFFVQMKQLLI